MKICSASDIGLPEILRLTGEQMGGSPDVWSLTVGALAKDENFFACFYLLANGRSGRDVAVDVGTDERTVRRWMARLDDLRLIEMRPKLRPYPGGVGRRMADRWTIEGALTKAEFDENSSIRLSTATARSLQFLSAELSTASYKVLLRNL